MTEKQTTTLAEHVKSIAKLQQCGELPRHISISSTIHDGKEVPSVFFADGAIDDLPEGERKYKSRNDNRYWPWEASVVKDGIVYCVWLSAEDSTFLYVG